MKIETYTERVKSAIQAAQTLALRHNHQQFTPAHILRALLYVVVPLEVSGS